MNVISLFDGMSCGNIALEELDVKVDKFYASEIDKFAVQMSSHLYPNIIHLGDITKWKEWDIDWKSINLVLAGSPCQGFSFAGKQLNFEDERSKLFFVFVDILNHIKKLNQNVKFLLENVNMKREYLGVISRLLNVYGVNINSNLVSAQNRNRWYWSNIRTKQDGLFGDEVTDIPQPKDEGILLKDILQPEEDIDEKYYIKNPKFGFEGMNINGKNNTLRTGGSQSQSQKHNYDLIKVDKKGEIKADQNKAGCLTAGGHSGGNHSDMDIICVAMRGRNPENSSDRTLGAPTEQRLEPKTDGKTNCLTSVGKDNLIMQINPSKESGNQPYQQNRIYDINGQMPELTSSLNGRNNISDNYKLRRLTPRECGRLQTVPEHIIDKMLSSGISDTQLYKQFGNGWTIKVISHILKHL